MAYRKAAHRKVKTGCGSCKKRRVKCDETKPKCCNCARHSLECSFSGIAHPTDERRKSAEAIVRFSFVDFKALHHWTVCTADSTVMTKVHREALRDVYPAMAVSHEYLMHAMLALSYLHMARLQPEEADKYEIMAAHHQDLALPPFRAALVNVTESNCHALWACGHLVTKYAFACPQSRESLVFSSSIGLISEYIILLRGTCSVAHHSMEWLSNGPLAFCLEDPANEIPDLTQNPDDFRLVEVLSILLTDDSPEVSVCCGALNMLRQVFAVAASPTRSTSVEILAYWWPAQVSQRYIQLVSERMPEALVVLAYYCVMLKKVDYFWFMNGCAAAVLNECRKHLDRRWHRCLEWPISCVLGPGMIVQQNQ